MFLKKSRKNQIKKKEDVKQKPDQNLEKSNYLKNIEKSQELLVFNKEVLFDKSVQAPPPLKDFLNLKVTKNEVCYKTDLLSSIIN